MRSIGLLRREHALIEKVADCLDGAADSVRTSGRVDEKLFLKALDFISGFTHRVHQAKEEILSRLAVDRRLVEAGGCASGDLLDFSGAMLRALPEAARGEPAARRLLAENAKAYVALIRSQVRSREILFEAAECSFAEGDDRALVALFEEAERRLGGRAVEHYGRLADEIYERSGALALRG